MMLTEDERALIEAMCQNNLVVTATARALHYHRNTIVYQIHQLLRKTGYDCRTFYGAANLLLLSRMEE